MTQEFEPYANEADVLRIGDLEIENRMDRVSLTGDVVFTKDKAGLTLAKELQSLIGHRPCAGCAKAAPRDSRAQGSETVKNPFA